MNNSRITESMLIESFQRQSQINCSGLHVIGIQDTTEYNYQHHKNRLKEDTLGRVVNNADVGYFAHLMVVFDAKSCLPQGISYCKMWSRPEKRLSKTERDYKHQPIEEKESYRWLEAADQTRNLLDTAKHFTFLSDRESDIYQLWDRVPDDKTDFIIRARGDRFLSGQDTTVKDTLNKLPVSGTYTVNIRDDKRSKRTCREAIIHVKYTELSIRKPNKLDKDQATNDHVTLIVVEAKEDPCSHNQAEQPIHWILYTTHAVRNHEEACRIIDWYSFRWQIEQFFRLTKSKGIDLESSQLETGEGLKKLGLMGFASALRILQLRLARDGILNDRVEKYFNPMEIVVLRILDKDLKGTTQKQQNPFPQLTLSWAAWIIARLGGYSGYISQSPPGPLTFKWGLNRFNQTVEAFILFRKDV